ncbi:alpha/beta-hydrolase [Thozetella sp. PMI_491]|nr:alpha/beta-hydrolase [Thozetella sp. PMI_491]
MQLSWAATALAAMAGAALGQTVTTSLGTVQGGKCDSTDVNYFFSIPYALPPVGDMRFAVAKPYSEPFNGTLDATTAAPSCIQFGALFLENGAQSEDCLFLNIWVPATATPSSGLPVKFWIYGGFDQAGGISDPTYNGCFSASDAIVVSANYRLGPLGFLALSSFGLTGNYAISDLLVALEWVQQNIHAFGGDPDKVLVFGESAGARNTFALATLPQAPKLMRAAIMESGGGKDYPSISNVQSWQSNFLVSLNCNTSDISCLRAASTSDLQKAVNAMPQYDSLVVNTAFDYRGAGSTWGPQIDGKIIPSQPSSVGVQVPSVFGFNAQDGSLFPLAQYGAHVLSLNETDYERYLNNSFGPYATEVNAAFNLSKFNSTSLPVLAAMMTTYTDETFKCPAYRGLLGANKNGVPAWTYNFSHTPSCAWFSAIPQSSLSILGATHTSEIPFVFNLTTNMPPPNGNCSFTATEKRLASAMSSAWTSFAASGRPADPDVWPSWTANTSMGINIVDTLEAGKMDFSICAKFWDNIDAALLALETTHFDLLYKSPFNII